MTHARFGRWRMDHRGQTGAGPSFSAVPGDSPEGTSRGMSRGHVPRDSTGRTGRDEGTWYIDDATGEVTEPAPSVQAPAVTDWEVAAVPGRSCAVCGTSMTDYPSSVNVCALQDDEHQRYRTLNGWAA